MKKVLNYLKENVSFGRASIIVVLCLSGFMFNCEKEESDTCGLYEGSSTVENQQTNSVKYYVVISGENIRVTYSEQRRVNQDYLIGDYICEGSSFAPY